MRWISGERVTGLISGIGFVGFVLTGWLVLSELTREPTCPPLFGVPACYLLVAAYLAATIGAWFHGQRWADGAFLAGAIVVTLIGTYFSWSQLSGSAVCPSFEGLPMCYVSLTAGLTMLALDQLRRRLPGRPVP